MCFSQAKTRKNSTSRNQYSCKVPSSDFSIYHLLMFQTVTGTDSSEGDTSQYTTTITMQHLIIITTTTTTMLQ
jgi:hypothetical protein